MTVKYGIYFQEGVLRSSVQEIGIYTATKVNGKS
jgi:hypothetical protein